MQGRPVRMMETTRSRRVGRPCINGENMVIVGKPKIEKCPKITYMGIRFIAPFKSMSKDIRKSANELNAWVDENKVKTMGLPFLRYHVIDMRGFMDLSFCVPVRKA